MGKNHRGVRDRTGPYRLSYQRKVFGKGKRIMAGQKCPERKRGR